MCGRILFIDADIIHTATDIFGCYTTITTTIITILTAVAAAEAHRQEMNIKTIRRVFKTCMCA